MSYDHESFKTGENGQWGSTNYDHVQWANWGAGRMKYNAAKQAEADASAAAESKRRAASSPSGRRGHTGVERLSSSAASPVVFNSSSGGAVTGFFKSVFILMFVGLGLVMLAGFAIFLIKALLDSPSDNTSVAYSPVVKTTPPEITTNPQPSASPALNQQQQLQPSAPTSANPTPNIATPETLPKANQPPPAEPESQSMPDAGRSIPVPEVHSVLPPVTAEKPQRFLAHHDGGDGCDGEIVFKQADFSFNCFKDFRKNFTVDKANVARVDKNGVELLSHQKYHFSKMGGMSKQEVNIIFVNWLGSAPARADLPDQLF